MKRLALSVVVVLSPPGGEAFLFSSQQDPRRYWAFRPYTYSPMIRWHASCSCSCFLLYCEARHYCRPPGNTVLPALGLVLVLKKRLRRDLA